MQKQALLGKSWFVVVLAGTDAGCERQADEDDDAENERGYKREMDGEVRIVRDTNRERRGERVNGWRKRRKER